MASVFNWDCFITCLKFLVVLQSYAVFNLESTLDEFCSYDTMVCLHVQVLNSLVLWFVPLTDLSMATAAKAHGYWSTLSLLPCQKRNTQHDYAEIKLQIIKSSEHKRDIIQWGNTEDSVSTDNLKWDTEWGKQNQGFSHFAPLLSKLYKKLCCVKNEKREKERKRSNSACSFSPPQIWPITVWSGHDCQIVSLENYKNCQTQPRNSNTRRCKTHSQVL